MGKSGNVYIDGKEIEKNAFQIHNAVDVLREDSLNPYDSESTLTVNHKLHQVFEESQKLIVLLGEVLDSEVENIRSLGVTFEQFDSMLASWIM